MNIKHIAESCRRVSGETAAGTHPSPEEGSDQSAYKVFSPLVPQTVKNV